ncbi:MAG: VWA domain-containing protein [Planctomycetota bacterium]
MLPSIIQFARPLVLIALPFAIAMAWWRRRGTMAGPRPQPLRWAAAGLLIIALAGPELRWGGDPTAMVALDASASQGRADPWAGKIPDGWAVEQIRFAADVQRPDAALDRTRTDLAPVLSLLADRKRPPTAAIVVTDGRFTDAETLEPLLKRVAARGTTFLWVGRAGGEADARVANLMAAVRTDGHVDVTATVEADAPMTRTLVVEWADQSKPIGTRQLQLKPGDPATVTVMTRLTADRPGRLRAALLEDDLLVANNRLILPVRAPTPTVLWLARGDAITATVPSGWTVHPVAFDAAAADPSALLAYDAVAVVDVSGEALSPAQRAALAGYVNLGGGLVLMGAGPYGPAAGADPLNGVLPLRVKRRSQRPLDVTMLLDASGSMGRPAGGAGGPRKFDLVRKAVMGMARKQLREGDRLRVITFGEPPPVPRFDRDVTPANLADLEEILRDVRPRGGTWISNALHRARNAAARPAADRVVLVLSDLRTERFDAARWAERLCASGAHLAVVAVGESDPAAPLKRLAGAAGGRFELCADLAGAAEPLGRLLDETRRTPLIRRVEVVRPTGPVFGEDLFVLPSVDARLAATARPEADVLAVAGEDAPLVACRDAGGGRAVHLAAPLEGPHNRGWRTAADARQVLTGAVAWVRPPARDPRYAGELHREGTRVLVKVTAEDTGNPINGLDLTARTTDADGTVYEAAFEQVAPGRYAAALAAPTDTASLIRVRLRGTDAVVWTGALAGGYGREFAATGIDRNALGAFAAVTEGYVVGADAVGGRLRVLDAARRTSLARWVLALALAAALADWFTTRATSPHAAGGGRRGRARAPSNPPTTS